MRSRAFLPGSGQHAPHTVHPLRIADRLGEIIGCAQSKASFFLADDGSNHHRDRLGIRVLLELAQHLQAIHVGEHDIQQDQGGFFAPGQRQRILAIGGNEDRVLVRFELVTEQLGDVQFVIHNEKPGGRSAQRRASQGHFRGHVRQRFGHHRQREAKRAAPAHCALNPDASAVHLDQRTRDDQPQSRARDIRRAGRGSAEKARKELGLVIVRHPDTRIADVHLDMVAQDARRHVNVPLQRVLERIGHQVGDNLSESAGIGQRVRQVLRDVQSELDALVTETSLEHGHHVIDDAAHRDRLEAHLDLAGLDARYI